MKDLLHSSLTALAGLGSETMKGGYFVVFIFDWRLVAATSLPILALLLVHLLK